MLTDVALKNFKPKRRPYKVTDRDGMYAHVAVSGRITFRLDYRLNGRRETLMLGRYGPAGLSLARAREKCIDARRMIVDGLSPAQEKQRQKRRGGRRRASGSSAIVGCRRRRWRTARAPCAGRSSIASCVQSGKSGC